jgi:predicted nucleic acid-binding protein
MGKRNRLDTNIIIYYLGGFLQGTARECIDSVLFHQPNISIISKIELFAWTRPSPSDINQLNEFTLSANTINLNDEVVNQTIFIRKYYKKLKSPDAIITAGCISDNLTLITRNAIDFKNGDPLEVINPFEL